MHICAVIALILFAAASVLAVVDKTYVAALIAAGLAVTLIPAAFQLTS